MRLFSAMCIAMHIFMFTFAHAAPTTVETPESLVRKFYTWYGTLSSGTSRKSPVFNDEILKYVYRHTVEDVRRDYNTYVKNYAYFMQANDIWDDFVDLFSVGKAISVNEDTYLVPFSHGYHSKEYTMVILVKKTHEGLRIIKVEDTSGF